MTQDICYPSVTPAAIELRKGGWDMAKVLTAKSVEAIKPDRRNGSIPRRGDTGLYPLSSRPGAVRAWRYRAGDRTPR